jgi:hypothetical protein
MNVMNVTNMITAKQTQYIVIISTPVTTSLLSPYSLHKMVNDGYTYQNHQENRYEYFSQVDLIDYLKRRCTYDLRIFHHVTTLFRSTLDCKILDFSGKIHLFKI